MSEENGLEHGFEDLSCIDTPDQYDSKQQQSEEPFLIVLVDIKKAAEEIIHCVEKPLMEDDDLKYVAISYRWGQLNETAINTGVDYEANVTSFSLVDFCSLCQVMTKEKDLQYIDYVWVDAICVDQSNYERRKATIYQMSNIYHRANYILAVPDLHLRHVRLAYYSNALNQEYIADQNELIFHLIHGNMDQLVQIENRDDGDKLDNAITYLVDLIKDWSNRVWVISELNIAKTKQKMKYWFIQITREYANGQQSPKPGSYYLNDFSFFEFDFNLESAPQLKFDILSTDTQQIREWKTLLEGCHKNFYDWMFLKLEDQSFLENILKARASKNVDRIYAILPTSQYKHMIRNKDEVDKWNITNLISLKLKLYEFMDTYDKLKLLFLSGSIASLTLAADILPSFATSNIVWEENGNLNWYFRKSDYAVDKNFDINSNVITLIHTNGYHKLNLRILQYFKAFGESSKSTVDRFWQIRKASGKRLGLDDLNEPLQVVYIPLFFFYPINNFTDEYYGESKSDDNDIVRYITLVGSFDKNIWVLHRDYELYLDTKEIIMEHTFGLVPGFDIY